jgi:ABC-type nitrate/sulfonate/bicarbonate transport system substrate-binding protein
LSAFGLSSDGDAFPQDVTALVNGAIDVAMMVEPTASLAIRQGARVKASDDGDNYARPPKP